MDRFEDFEFKPITEGLGFQKKAQKIRNDMQRAQVAEESLEKHLPDAPPLEQVDDLPITDRPASKSISELMAALPPSLDFSPSSEARPPESLRSSLEEEPKIFKPLPRRAVEEILDTESALRNPSVSRQLNSTIDTPKGQAQRVLDMRTTLPPVNSQPPKPLALDMPVPSATKKSIDASLEKAFPKRDLVRNQTMVVTKQEMTVTLQEVPAAFSAGFLDGLVVTGISLLCMVILIWVAELDLFRLLSHPTTQNMAALQLLVLVLGVTQIYMLTSRSLFGMTLGEWAFDSQLGTPDQQLSLKFPFQVLGRSLVTSLTGFILFPLLAKIFSKDLLASLFGLSLFERK